MAYIWITSPYKGLQEDHGQVISNLVTRRLYRERRKCFLVNEAVVLSHSRDLKLQWCGYTTFSRSGEQVISVLQLLWNKTAPTHSKVMLCLTWTVSQSILQNVLFNYVELKLEKALAMKDFFLKISQIFQFLQVTSSYECRTSLSKTNTSWFPWAHPGNNDQLLPTEDNKQQILYCRKNEILHRSTYPVPLNLHIIQMASKRVFIYTPKVKLIRRHHHTDNSRCVFIFQNLIKLRYFFYISSHNNEVHAEFLSANTEKGIF